MLYSAYTITHNMYDNDRLEADIFVWKQSNHFNIRLLES